MECAVDRGGRKHADAPTMLMWAVRTSGHRRLVHIGMLSKDENGAACGCVCRACGEPMLAVNVDKSAEYLDKPGTQRPHFKHRRTTQDESRCQSKIAQLLALQLFVGQQMIYLPVRRRQISRVLANGKTVKAEQIVPDGWAKVHSRTYVDEQSAILVLEDGRELVVTVRARHTVDESSRSTCVLSLAGLIDPIISSWGSEQILGHLRMPESGIGWVHHWEDSQLQAQEDVALEQSEDAFLGGIPREWLEELSGKQFNETVLHWLIKKTIEEMGQMRVPAIEVAVAHRMPDGTIAEVTARWPGMLLQLENVRLEKRLGNLVPDVLCRAQQADRRGPPFDLIIEAAVTHYIDEQKKKKLIDAGVACIEIRADLFGKAGNVPVAEIQDLVCADATVKEWVVHPWIGRAIESANGSLVARGKALQRRMDEEARKRRAEKIEKERAAQKLSERQREISEWTAQSSNQSLVKGYRKILSKMWVNNTVYQDGELAGTQQNIWDELVRRQLVMDGQRGAIESQYGLVYALLRVQEQPWDAAGHRTIERFRRSIEDYMGEPKEALVLMWALESKRGHMNTEETSKCDVLCHTLRTAIENQKTKYRRDTQNDRLLGLLFPDIAQALQSDYGTSAHFDQLRATSERRKQWTIRREARVAVLKAGRKAQAEKASAAAIASELNTLSGTLRWQSFPFGDPNPAQLYAKHNHKVKLHSVNSLEILKRATQHRTSGASVDKALASMAFKDARDIGSTVTLLLAAGLCFRVTKSE